MVVRFTLAQRKVLLNRVDVRPSARLFAFQYARLIASVLRDASSR